jgi:hypothetical protein
MIDGVGGTGHQAQSAGRLATARSLAVDRVTAEVVGALRAEGVYPILLKGPSIALWLYTDGAARAYVDSDLLVPPQRVGTAERVLQELGFRHKRADFEGPQRGQVHGRPWWRPTDRAEVDLHITLWGLGVSPAEAWARLVAHTEAMSVGGTTVQVLATPARALHLALHAAQHASPPARQPREDLARALEQLPEAAWVEAAALAEEIGAPHQLVQGLQTLPAGAALVDRLGFLDPRLAELAVLRGSPAPLVVGVHRLAATRGVSRKLRLIAQELFPPPSFLRWWSPLARRGAWALPLAYVSRLAWLVWHLGPSVRVWRQVHGARRLPWSG